jgi:hypothetical protein
MAEQELINHTKKALKILENKNISFWHKLKDFVLEIAIIVFAISLSIWFHNWSEHKNEQKTVKVFLLGLKSDLHADITDTKELMETNQQYKLLYTYLSTLNNDKIPSNDTFKLALNYIQSYSFLRPHKSRFNGFLSAGKIMTIENDSLLIRILNYYQEILPALQTSEEVWENEHKTLLTYFTDNVKNFDSDMDKFRVLSSSKGKFLSKELIPWQQLIDRYQAVIDEGNKIISAIENSYPNSD